MSMVEWKKLGDVCEVLRGKRLTKSQLSETEGYPVLHGGSLPMGYYCDFNRKANTTVVVNTGNAGCVFFYDKEFWSSDACFSLYPNEKLIDKYLYLYIYGCERILKGKIRAGAMPTIDAKAVESLIIPIPPLSEQQRIVDILDTFTSSIENLKEQIAQRRKQYEFYRDLLYYPSKDALLKAAEEGKVETKTLDEIGTFTRGRRFVRTDIVPEGVPCIHYGDMYTYYGISADTTPTHLTKENAAKLRFAKKGDVVIVAAGENDLDIGVGVAWLGEEDVVVHDACFIFKHKMESKYISYYLRSRNYHQQIRMGVVDGKICSISAKELGRTIIPIPSLSEQQRIVSILDTFESSIQNLEQQLALREKQYEYYRNKLLTFE